MPRTIDSLSPKQEDSQPTLERGSATNVAKTVDELQGTTLREDKAARLKRKKVPRKRNPQKLVVGGLLVLAVLSIAAVIWYWPTLNGGKIGDNGLQDTKESLSQLGIVKGLNDQDKDSFYKQTGAEYAAAKKIGIEPDPSFAGDEQTLSILAGGNPTAEKSAQALKQLIQNRLDAVKQNGFIEGYVYNFWFGDTAIKWPSTSKVANAGSPQALADDKRYASEKAESARQRLQNGSITPDQLLDEIKKDRRLRLIDDPNGSARFALARPKQTTLENDTSGSQQYLDTLASMQSVGLSPLMTRSYVSAYDKNKTPIEAGYQFVQMTKVVVGDAAVRAYEDYLKQAGGWQW